MESLTTQLVLAADAAIDLQMHTIYSDGLWTPEQLIDYLVSEQFGLVAITDHDRVDTIISIQELAAQKQLPVLAAVEMSTSWNGREIDVLCYGVNPHKKELQDLGQDVRRRQIENTKEVYANLCRKGYTFRQKQEGDEEPLAAILAKPSAQQPHALISLLEAHGYGTKEPSAGEIIVEAGFFWTTNDIAAVVDAAHRSDAVCLIAHPGRGKGFPCAMLDELRLEIPIDGLEAYYPTHTAEQRAMYLEYAQTHDLLVSSGSDSHDPDNKPVKYRAELSRRLLARVGIQVK
ncbi:MAG TPA: PHP domain-containing protein [Ktedonobacteraceae bacterium]|nr:PHP domain-containing protein [Ktedonobacteraceae bacterium]